MLVISRKVGQSIRIGAKISVSIEHLGNGAVRLGIEAPAEASIVEQGANDEQRMPAWKRTWLQSQELLASDSRGDEQNRSVSESI